MGKCGTFRLTGVNRFSISVHCLRASVLHAAGAEAVEEKTMLSTQQVSSLFDLSLRKMLDFLPPGQFSPKRPCKPLSSDPASIRAPVSCGYRLDLIFRGDNGS